MTPNTFKAIVRSLTPWVISGIVYVVTHLGFHISMVVATEVAGIVGTLLTILAHWLETKWRWFGVLLGWIGAPQYVPGVTKAQLQAQIAALEAQLGAPGTTVPTTPPAPVEAPTAPVSDPAPGAPAPVA